MPTSTADSTKVYYPQTIEEQPFIGPIQPVNGKSNTKEVYYQPVVSEQPIPRPTVASNVVSSSLDTQSRRILGTFSFTSSGSLQVGKYKSGVSGDVRISPNGIVGRNSSGVTTFSIDGTTGNATFLGTITAGSVISATIAATNITGTIVNAQIANIDWAKIQNVAIVNADIVNLSASKITSGDVASARLTANVLTALQANVSTLSAITADIGTITAGSITGVTITGGTIRTASSGLRVQLSSSLLGEINWYDSGGNNDGTIALLANSLVIESADDILFSSPITMASGRNIDMTSNDVVNVDKISGSSGNIDFDESGRIQISNHFDPPDGGGKNMGGSSRYWGEINYKTLTDRGCLGWFDDGVELQDGTIVSDIEAILNVGKHETKKTIYGVPMLDYATLPKVVYKRAADHDGTEYPRDPKTGEPLPFTEDILEFRRDKKGKLKKVKVGEKIRIPQDGAETTALISIMFGALKELANEQRSIRETLSKVVIE